MRITFVMPRGGLAGGNRVAAIYAGRLAARGHDVHVAWTMPRRVGRRRQLIAALTGRTPERREGSLYFDGLGVRQSTAAAGPVRDADVPDADVIVATWWETAFAVAALSPSKGEKVYFVQHHEVHDHLPAHITRGSYYLPLHKVTISQWLVDLMADTYGDTDVDLVENSVDTDLFHAPPRAKNAVPTVGLLYSPTRFKGVDVSLRAIQRARTQVPDLRVIAFGKGAPVSGLPLPPGSDYVRNPAQERIREIYASCDVWLCGSREEGFHLPPLEAMACRTPVVATRVGGAVDVVTDGVDGWVVDVEDDAALGQRLAEVAALPPEAWRAMSDAAHARARAYSWDDATDRFESALARRLPTPPIRRAQ